ncbi:TPA: restriction endonuclease subunit S [Photobacterium damselae]
MVPSFLKDAANRGWKVARLDALLKSKDILGHLDGNHGNLYPRSSEFVDSGIKYISANALIDGKVNLSKSKYLTHERGAQFKKGVAIDGDVLFAHNATVGPVALLTTNDDYVILSTSLTYYRCALDKVDNKYLVQYMASPAFVRQYEKIMKQTTRNQIPITAQRDFYFVLPPLPEQRKIAQILSTWDKAISTTEKLIDTSKQQKKALMQQLLTGKKRLVDPETGKAFEGDWELSQLKNCVKFLNGQRKPIKQEERANIQGQYPYYGATGIIDYVNDYIFDDELILLGEDGENILSRVLPHVFVVRGKVWINNHAHVFKANKNMNTDFLCMYLESLDYKKYNSGSAQPKINKAVCEKIPVMIPLLKEQQKIASVLTAADKEIELLNAKLAHLKQEKKALMQQLLTGKRRVKVAETEAA